MNIRTSGRRAARTARRGAAAGAATALVLAAGCTSGGAQDAGDASGPTRSIEHRYGTTEISGTPERVVTVGLTEQDYVLALGTDPVGVREWFGGHDGALWPWAEERLEGETPEVLPVDELNIEQIATLEPDLILGINSGITEEEYDRLSELAPTVAQPTDHADFGAPWQEITTTVGTALDKEDEAEELVAGIEERFEEVRSEHPEFEDSTALLTSSISGEAWAYAEGPAPGFLTQLGMEMPADAEALFTDENREPQAVALEELEAIEADAVLVGVYGEPEDSFSRLDVFTELDTAKEGRYMEMAEMSRLNGALSFGSVLSLDYALDELPPRLEEMLDGDPDTEPAEAE